MGRWPGDLDSVHPKGSVVVRNLRGSPLLCSSRVCRTWSSEYILFTLIYWQLTIPIVKGQGGHTSNVTSAHLYCFTTVVMSTGLVSFSSGDALTSLCVQVSWLAGSSPSRIIENIS